MYTSLEQQSQHGNVYNKIYNVPFTKVKMEDIIAMPHTEAKTPHGSN